MANEKKDGLIRDIINKVRCMYTTESGLVKHIENGLKKATNVALSNLDFLINLKIREAKRSTDCVDIEIAASGADQYYVDQLKKIPTNSRYPSNFKFSGAHYPPAGGYSEPDVEPKEVQTKWMSLNTSSAAILIQWLKSEFKIVDTYLVVQDVDDIAFVGSFKECTDYRKGNSQCKLHIRTIAQWKSGD